MRVRVMAAAGAAALLSATGLTAGLVDSASAGTGVVKPVVNVDGGVFWRSSPDWNTPVRVVGHGVYNGDRVELECWVRGGTVPPYWNNPLWYDARIVSGQGVGEGLVNDHFLDTGVNVPNQIVPGVPPCNSGTPNPTPTPAPPAATNQNVAYYSGEGSAGAAQARTLGFGRVLTADGSFDGKWPGGGSCQPSANAVAFAGKTITRLSGWSLGRLGPIYALRYLKDHNPDAAKKIDYVVLYDPGTPSPGNFGTCDAPGTSTVRADQTLAWWLGLSRDNRLIIMSGSLTATNHHQSIQQNYFPAIKRAGTAVRGQVLVCNYSLSHEAVWKNYAYLMTKDRLSTVQGLTSCPQQGASQVWGWNP